MSSHFELPGADAKIGKHSVYLWGAVLAGAVVIYIWYSRSAGSSTDTTGSDLSSVGMPTIEPSTSGSSATPATDTTGTDTSGDTTDTADTATNASWESKAVALLTGNGVSGIDAESAIENYLNGNELSYADYGRMNQVLAALGLPPEGTLAIPTYEGPPAATPKPTAKPTKKAAPKPPAHKPTAPAHHAATHHAAPKKKTKKKVITIKHGDTLSAIAKKEYGHATPATIHKIAKANGIKNPNLIYAGHKLVIPR